VAYRRGRSRSDADRHHHALSLLVAIAAAARFAVFAVFTGVDRPASGARDPRSGYKAQIDSLRGQLLIAGATLPDPNFARTVVLICEHSEEGALGLVLNRPGELVIADWAPELALLVGDDGVIDSGGPVQPEALLVLADFEDVSHAGMPVIGTVGLMGDGTVVEDLAGVTRRARVFSGYAGWGPGQLDDELQRGDWFVAPAGIDDIFDPDAEELWRRVLARKGGHYALVARMPIDPSVN
jgi:putative transcriptional regulator